MRSGDTNGETLNSTRLEAALKSSKAGGELSALQLLIYESRPDLQVAFKITEPEGLAAFKHWYSVSAEREYPNIAMSQEAVGAEVPFNTQTKTQAASNNSRLLVGLAWLRRSLGALALLLPRSLHGRALSIWNKFSGYLLRVCFRPPAEIEMTTAEHHDLQIGNVGHCSTLSPGANLIGYVHAELGMGEHVRMSCRALENTAASFSVTDFDAGSYSRKRAPVQDDWLESSVDYWINLIHVNADQTLWLMLDRGFHAFVGHYNVGYWAWELPRVPPCWLNVIGLIDEIWAPSRFIQDAFLEVADVPVTYMPLCVEIPVASSKNRADFKLPEDDFLFIFAFDFYSYMDRKNPFDTIRAFQRAFPSGKYGVGLVIKVMNGNLLDPQWRQMMELIGADKRIHVINEVLIREDVLALFKACDCFLSLHRSEGFGRGPAEAMLLEKPVIVTDYSGTSDFCTRDTALLVDYELVPVRDGQYPFFDNQVWAQPSVEHAAEHMRAVAQSRELSSSLGKLGRQYVMENFSAQAIGSRYVSRLQEISERRD